MLVVLLVDCINILRLNKEFKVARILVACRNGFERGM